MIRTFQLPGVARRFASVLIVLGTAWACAQASRDSNVVLDQLLGGRDCDDVTVPVVVADSALTEQQGCGLAAAALEVVRADSTSRSLLEISDLTPREMRVRSMEMRSFSDSLMGSWWVVTLDLPQARYNADVRFAKESGQANVEVVHKPLM